MKKNKQINPLEQHFEKLVLAAVCVVLLAVVAMQFLTQPNAVKVGSSPPVPPDQVFNAVKTEAEQLIAQMRAVDPPLIEVPEQDVATRFEQVRGLAIAESIELSKIGGQVEIDMFDGEGGGAFESATTYALPKLPVPGAIVAQSYRAAVDPYAAVNNEELRKHLPAQQPFDVAAVSIEGRVTGEMLRQSLEVDPDGESGPLHLLPLTWWRGNLDLIGVEVQREELGSDGQWGGATVVSGTPGQPSALEELRRPGITPMELQRVAQQAEAMARDIAQPQFPPTIAGPEWTPPSQTREEAGMSDEDRQKSQAKRQLERLDTQIAAKQKQLEEVGGGGGRVERPTTGGGGGRIGGERGGQPRPTVDREAQRREQLQREIDALQKSREQVVARLAELGEVVEEDPGRAASGGRDEPAAPLPRILEAEELPVWVHDLSAEPGKTYRYRMRVVVNNPLFGRGQFLAEAQQGASKSPVLEGDWSPWSEPVAMEADRHFFVKSATQDDAYGNPPRAAVEMYQFYYGYWRKASATLEPGDTVHARAKLPDNLFTYDLTKLKAPAQTTRPGQEPAFVPGGEGGGGRRIIEPEMDERLRYAPEGERRPAQPGATAEQPIPEGATRIEPWLEMSLPAMLLDVARLPGGTDSFQAILRQPDGRIAVHGAGSETGGALYRRLEANAREGERQGQPEPTPSEPRVLPGREEERTRDFGDPGGGGGGGG